ncbi:hypothetical protein [Pseudonocardia sp. ICBG601]|uniref:hypothetical protein n=1 Tax=Pseudonocardia sp. ICBG601 TaxID=2846759 RepID=UPI001CF6C8C3|nr:hypothetical protein [Pseudonocardia sp. ICBG601]
MLIGAAPEAAADPISDLFNDCKAPPVPTDPSGGFLGTLDELALREPMGAPGPHSSEQTLSRLGDVYGYAGLSWSNYNLGCAGGVRDPGASIDTMIGGFFLGTAKMLFAAQNGLHELVVMDPTGPAVGQASEQTAQALFAAVFSPWSGVALVVGGAILLMASRRGDAGEIVTRSALIVAALTIAALSFGSGAQIAQNLSGSVGQVMSATQNWVTREAFPDQLGAGGEALRHAIYQQVLYRSWADGQVGVSGRDEAAWELFTHQALDYHEWWSILDGQGERSQVFEDKGAKWMAYADGQLTPTEYVNTQGKGDSRAALGAGALLVMLPIALIQIFALLIQYMLVLFLACIPMAAPVVGLWGIVRTDVPEKAARVVGAVVFGAGIACVCAVAHSVLILGLARAGELTDVAMIVVSWLSTILLWMVLRPILSLSGIVSSARAVRSRGARAVSGVRRAVASAADRRDREQARRRGGPGVLVAIRTGGGPGEDGDAGEVAGGGGRGPRPGPPDGGGSRSSDRGPSGPQSSGPVTGGPRSSPPPVATGGAGRGEGSDPEESTPRVRLPLSPRPGEELVRPPGGGEGGGDRERGRRGRGGLAGSARALSDGTIPRVDHDVMAGAAPRPGRPGGSAEPARGPSLEGRRRSVAVEEQTGSSPAPSLSSWLVAGGRRPGVYRPGSGGDRSRRLRQLGRGRSESAAGAVRGRPETRRRRSW